MGKNVIAATAVATGAFLACGAAFGGMPNDQAVSLWNQACVHVAKGDVFENPGPLDCENPRTSFPNFSSEAVRKMQRICEEKLAGTFVQRSEDSEHVYCFLG